MRTNIDIDDTLISEAMRATGARTKKAAVEEGLKLLIRLAGQLQAVEDMHGLGWEEISTPAARAAACDRGGQLGLDRHPARACNPQVALLRDLSGRTPLIVGDIVLAEVLQGARDEAHAARIERDLRRHTVMPMVGDEIATRAARNYRTLRRAGSTVRKTIDLLIGTFCIERSFRLLHDDRDFDQMERLLGLSIVR